MDFGEDTLYVYEEKMKEKKEQGKENILPKKSSAPFIIRRIWIWYHLIFMCPYCKEEKWYSRDINNENKCYWKDMWGNGVDNIPLWMDNNITDQYAKRDKTQ